MKREVEAETKREIEFFLNILPSIMRNLRVVGGHQNVQNHSESLECRNASEKR